MVIWNVQPEIFTWGVLKPRWYGLMFVFGFLLGYRFIFKAAQEEGKDTSLLDSLLLYLIFGTTIGARLGHVLFYEPLNFLAHPLDVFKIWQGGLASHGGGLGVIIALFIFSRRYPSYPFIWLLDRVSIPTVLTGAFIRIGNLMNSEIIGRPTGSPASDPQGWGFIFTRVDQIPRHPTQIYESLCYFAIFFIALGVYRRWKTAPRPGFYFGLVISLIYMARIGVEFFKENQEIWESGLPLNMGQMLSLPYVALGLWLMFRSFGIFQLRQTSQ